MKDPKLTKTCRHGCDSAEVRTPSSRVLAGPISPKSPMLGRCRVRGERPAQGKVAGVQCQWQPESDRQARQGRLHLCGSKPIPTRQDLLTPHWEMVQMVQRGPYGVQYGVIAVHSSFSPNLLKRAASCKWGACKTTQGRLTGPVVVPSNGLAVTAEVCPITTLAVGQHDLPFSRRPFPKLLYSTVPLDHCWRRCGASVHSIDHPPSLSKPPALPCLHRPGDSTSREILAPSVFVLASCA